ncbi:GNAT family N-acetyltransferase [Phreatobacter sp. HK31-P]
MSAIAEPMAGRPLPCDQSVAGEAAPFAVRVVDNFAAAHDDWLALEAEAPLSGYQRLAWQETFQRHLGDGADGCIAVIADTGGTAQALLPFAIVRRRGLAVASFIGGKHANFAMGLWRPAFARTLGAAELAAAFRAIAARSPHPIDLFELTNQPVSWAGLANPLALLPHRPSPSFGYHLALGPDADAVLERVVSASSRRKMRKKERNLAEIGPVTFAVAGDAATIARFTDAFLAYKAARFAELGIPNVFDVPGMRDFIIEAASGPRPAIELCALKVGDEIVALFGGCIANGRYSGMFNAMAPGDVRHESPGELLLHHLIRDCCARGLTVFDLGAGEADYKSNICDGVDPLFDQSIAVSWKGALAARAFTAVGSLKRRAKQSAWLWPLIVKARRLRGRSAA